MSHHFTSARVSFERGVTKCWGEDEWAGCAWTHPSVPQLLFIMRPEGRIHFAGEHTSLWASWMQGALESGNRVVTEIEEAVRASAA
ncbi:MAG TPA: FAD-dependent oxidoreductase [Pyrinomonadaceae bacterium]|nr:FAD-dependent oxidoreductase [Pyrinomonadaceae bacterium]